MASSFRLTVTLEFASGPSRDMTLDPRTVYDVSGANGVFTLDQSGGRVTVVATSILGMGELRVGFSNQAYENVTAAIVVRVVGFGSLSVEATPFPAYTGSALMPVTTMAPINGSVPLLYQSVVLATTLRLSDGHAIPLGNGAVMFEALESDAVGASAASSVSLDNAGGIVTGQREGKAFVFASFGGERSADAAIS